MPRTADGGLLPVEQAGNECGDYLIMFQCRERLMGDCYSSIVAYHSGVGFMVSVPRTADGGLLPEWDELQRLASIARFQCRERLMGDCYKERLMDINERLQQAFQCRERLMGDCY